MEFTISKSIFKKPLFLETVIFLAIVGILNYVATVYHLYWSINEFDSVVHFLGGATVSLFFAWLYFFSGIFNPADRSLGRFLVVCIVGSMLVAVLWEVFELMIGVEIARKPEYLFDTTMDFIMDFLGALAACFYGFMKEITPTPPQNGGEKM